MRTLRRLGLTLLIALALSPTANAQTVADDRFTLNAAVGPSFASLGTTFSTTAALDVHLTDRAAVVGEFGMLPHAAFSDAAEIAVPLAVTNGRAPRVDAYHWNANLKVRPFADGKVEPYLTGGLGSFTAATIAPTRTVTGGTVQPVADSRRVTDFSTNLGAGVLYRLNDWAALSADYRTFFVHRTGDTPRVNRFTTGIMFSLD